MNRSQTYTIQAAASGDPEAFRALVLENQSNVRGLLLRLTGFQAERADDLAQETFIRVFKNLSSFRFDSDFKSWLFRITYNVFLDNQRRSTGEWNELKESDVGTYTTGADERVDMERVLQVALCTLKPAERTAIVLTLIEEQTQEDAATTMKIPLGTLKSHVLRGKEQMRSIFLKHGLEVSI